MKFLENNNDHRFILPDPILTDRVLPYGTSLKGKMMEQTARVNHNAKAYHHDLSPSVGTGAGSLHTKGK